MNKTTAISVRVDGELKEQSEKIMAEFGLNMTTTITMLLKQIVREQAIPLSLSISSDKSLRDDLIFAQLARLAGYKGRPADEVADKMDAIVSQVEGDA